MNEWMNPLLCNGIMRYGVMSYHVVVSYDLVKCWYDMIEQWHANDLCRTSCWQMTHGGTCLDDVNGDCYCDKDPFEWFLAW